MKKGQISFAFAGLTFGLLVGFVVAHQIYAGRGAVPTHPPIPAGMSGSMGGAAGAAQAPGMPPGGSQGEGCMETMKAVQREITALKELLEKDPKNVMALARLGDFYFDAGMFDKSAAYYEEALEISPDNVNVRTDLGTCLRNLGKPEEAMRHFETAVEDEPDHWKGWFNIGLVSLYDLQDFDRAMTAFERVAVLKPGTVDMDKLRQEIQQEMEKFRSSSESDGGTS